MKHVLVIVLQKDGSYHMEEVKDDPRRKFYTHGEHRYLWDMKMASLLIGWFPWQKPTMNPLRFLYYWGRRRVESTYVLFYVELPDKPDPTLLVSPVTHANHIAKGYSRVTPSLFRGALTSPLYKRYEKSTKFGAAFGDWKTLILVIGAVAGILILLYAMGWFDQTPTGGAPLP